MLAVEKCDWRKGSSSHLRDVVDPQAITPRLADTARTIRIPVHMVEAVQKVRKIQEDPAISTRTAVRRSLRKPASRRQGPGDLPNHARAGLTWRLRAARTRDRALTSSRTHGEAPPTARWPRAPGGPAQRARHLSERERRCSSCASDWPTDVPDAGEIGKEFTSRASASVRSKPSSREAAHPSAPGSQGYA